MGKCEAKSSVRTKKSAFTTDRWIFRVCYITPEYGLRIKSKSKAIGYLYIQPQFKILYYLIFDIDREEAGASWIDADLPPPTYIIVNLDNGYAHLIYELRIPVLTWDNANSKPIAYFDAIRMAYTEALLGADLSYTSLITKNPHHEKWDVITHSCRYGAYLLVGGDGE